MGVPEKVQEMERDRFRPLLPYVFQVTYGYSAVISGVPKV